MAGGTIERSCYSPHYVNTERDYERDYQATLPQGRTAADGCKPRHGRDDRKRERSFSGLRGTPSLREVRAEGWSELSPRCVGAAARRAGLSPSLCDAPISRRPVCFLLHTLTPLDPRNSEGFSRVPMDSGPESSDCYQLGEKSYGPGGSILEKVFFWRYRASPLPRSKTFMFLGVAGGPIERSCYSPH